MKHCAFEKFERIITLNWSITVIVLCARSSEAVLNLQFLQLIILSYEIFRRKVARDPIDLSMNNVIRLLCYVGVPL